MMVQNWQGTYNLLGFPEYSYYICTVILPTSISYHTLTQDL